MADYTIERLRSVQDFTPEIHKFLAEEVPKISKMFNDVFNYENCIEYIFAEAGVFLLCKRNNEITGLMIAFLFKSPFDYKTILLQQQLFYVKPNSGRTAYYLFKKFIDIGKSEANHIITMLTSQTNIKPQTLEKMGFKELETLYRLEV